MVTHVRAAAAMPVTPAQAETAETETVTPEQEQEVVALLTPQAEKMPTATSLIQDYGVVPTSVQTNGYVCPQKRVSQTATQQAAETNVHEEGGGQKTAEVRQGPREPQGQKESCRVGPQAPSEPAPQEEAVPQAEAAVTAEGGQRRPKTEKRGPEKTGQTKGQAKKEESRAGRNPSGRLRGVNGEKVGEREMRLADAAHETGEAEGDGETGGAEVVGDVEERDEKGRAETAVAQQVVVFPADERPTQPQAGDAAVGIKKAGTTPTTPTTAAKRAN